MTTKAELMQALSRLPDDAVIFIDLDPLLDDLDEPAYGELYQIDVEINEADEPLFANLLPYVRCPYIIRGT